MHELKTNPEFFRKVWKGIKTAEIRFDDRDYQTGDMVILKEWKPRKKVFTGYEKTIKVTDVLRLARVIPGVDYRWVMLSFEEIVE